MGGGEQAYLDQMLAISVREEEVVLKIQETDRAVERLQAMLKETQQQLQRRLRSKDKVGGWAGSGPRTKIVMWG